MSKYFNNNNISDINTLQHSSILMFILKGRNSKLTGVVSLTLLLKLVNLYGVEDK